MILTELDAAKKRCTPAVVLWLIPRDDRDGLSAAGLEVGGNCIGSRCMQWNWWDYVGADGKSYAAAGANPQAKGRAEKTTTSKPITPRGFCGLCKHSEL